MSQSTKASRNEASGNKAYTLGELAQLLGAQLHGDAEHKIQGIATLQSADAQHISFLANPAYTKHLQTTHAGAVLIKPQMLDDCPVDALVLDDPYFAYARLSHHFDPAPVAEPGVHASAVVAPSAELGQGVAIAANAVVGEHVVIGDGTSIGPNSVIGDHARIGQQCRLHGNVTLYHHVVLGDRVGLHSGTVIGADGFGYANAQHRWHKIAQIGSVRIGDDVEIGALSAVDRGALDDTIIETGVIIDNHVQIAHNCVIGEFTAIAGCVGIAGSTRLGKYCTIAGQAGIAGHLTLCDSVHVGMQAQVTNSITRPGSYSSGTGLMETALWRKNAARFRRLNTTLQKLLSKD